MDQNIEIWGQSWESIKMLKFECKMSSQSNWVKRGDWSKCLNLNEKAMINQNVEFDCECGNRSKCWNLSAKCQVNQNVEIWVKRGDWSKCPNLSERGNQWKHWNLKTEVGAIWMLMVKSIKMLKLGWKGNNQSKCWNLSANMGINQNVEIWAKGEIDQMYIFYCKSGNWSKC